MTDNQKWEYIGKTIKKLETQSKRFDEATDKLMICPESPLVEPFGWLTDFLLDSLSLMVGDTDGNISWFIYDCEYGGNPKEAGCEGNMREIETIEDLRWLVELDCE